MLNHVLAFGGFAIEFLNQRTKVVPAAVNYLVSCCSSVRSSTGLQTWRGGRRAAGWHRTGELHCHFHEHRTVFELYNFPLPKTNWGEKGNIFCDEVVFISLTVVNVLV